MSLSKIAFFLYLIFTVIGNSSCNRNNDVIPDVYVNFNIDIYDPEFVDLNALGGTVTVDAKTNNIGSGAAGYNGNGIIVHAWVDEFFAYDRTCPHEYMLNGQSIQVDIDPENSQIAICPECGTSYSLPSGGTPINGPGKYPLKNYRTSFDGRSIWVRNY